MQGVDPTDLPAPRPLRALALIALASLSFASLSAAIKAAAPETGLAPAILARGLLGFLACALWARARGQALAPRGRGMLALRCLAGGAAMLCYYYAFTRGGTDLTTAAMLLKTAPLWVALLAPSIVRETPGPRLWGALVLGLLGVALRYGFSLEGEQAGVVLSLLAGLLSAFAYLSLRALARSDSPLAVVTWFSLFLTLAPLPFLGPALRECAGWSARAWWLLLAIGALGTAGQLFLTAAYRYGSAAAVTLGGLCEVGMALGYSSLVFGEVPGAAAILGGLLAMGAGIVAQEARAEPSGKVDAPPRTG